MDAGLAIPPGRVSDRLAVPVRARGQAASIPALHPALDTLRIVVSLLIILNVSRIHQHFAAIAIARPALLLVFASGAYALLNPRRLSAEGLLKTRQARVIIGLALFACVSAPFGLSLGNSGRYIIESYSKVIIAALLLIAAIRSARDLYTFVWAYVIGCGILSWLSIFVFGLTQDQGSAAYRLNDLYSYDANDIGVVLSVGIPLTLLLIQSAKMAGKLTAAVILIGIGVTFARSGSRGGFLGLVATLLALLFMLRSVPIWKRLSFVAVTAVTLVLAAPGGYWEQMRTIVTPRSDYNWDSIDGRRELAKRGLSYMLSYPVFGLGMNNFWRAECLDPVSDKVRFHQASRGIWCAAPHNSHVQVAAELGVPGLVLWGVLIFGTIAGLSRLRQSVPREWHRGDREQRFLYLATMYLAVAMIGFAVTSTFVTFAWLDIIYVLAAFAAGLHVALGHRIQAQGSPDLSPAPRPGPSRARALRGSVLQR